MILGKYINSRPENEPMKVMFLRESKGVYKFGKKTVVIMVNRNGDILAKVGGGFVPID